MHAWCWPLSFTNLSSRGQLHEFIREKNDTYHNQSQGEQPFFGGMGQNNVYCHAQRNPSDYDKNACDILVACLIILGTKCLLDDSDGNRIKAGIVAQTVLFVTMILTSGGEPGPFERYDYSSKSRDL